jgi:MerR family copper efflux transcriptional regulator
MNIGQASKVSGVSQRMIRHYEAIGLIAAPARRESGYRDYSERDLHALKFIARARDLGFPVPEIGRLLALWRDQERSSAEVRELALARIAQLKAKEREIAEMRRTLETLALSCHGDDRPDCPILEELADQASV